MPIAFNTDATSSTSSITNPSSENLLTLIVITGGLLFICLILLIIVMLRSRARRKRALLVTPPQITPAFLAVPIEKKEDLLKQEEWLEPVAEDLPNEKNIQEVIKPLVKEVVPEKKVVEVVIKNAPVVLEKEEVVKPLVEAKKEDPIVKVEEKKEDVKPVVETKKPDEVIVKIEQKKPEITPYTTTIEEKKETFRKALEETQSKEDNLKILQERLAELTKEKKTTVTFVEPENVEAQKKEEPVKEAKKEPVEHVKLVDLTALINEKLQGKTEKVTAPEITEKEKEETEQLANASNEMPEKIIEPTVNKNLEEESHKILTPFFDNIKLNKEQPEIETHKDVIVEIEEALSLRAIEDNAEIEKSRVEHQDEKEIEKLKETLSQSKGDTPRPKDDVPKTFTEWLSTLKK